MFAQAHAQHLSLSAGRFGRRVAGVCAVAERLSTVIFAGIETKRSSDMGLVGLPVQGKVESTLMLRNQPWYPTSENRQETGGPPVM